MSSTNKPLYIGAFLVGATKCGTTTIADWLFQHPQITSVREYLINEVLPGTMNAKEMKAVANIKEKYSPRIMLSRIKGASIGRNKKKVRVRLFRSHRWERKRFRKRLARFLPDTPQTRPSNFKTIAADCTRTYFKVAGAAEAIKSLYPDARILITLRHPTDRVCSWYYMRVRNHGVKEPFQAAVIDKLMSHGSKPAKGPRPPTSSHQALAHWLDVFGRERIKILILEEWRRRPIQTAQECYRFIGVDDAFVPKPVHLNAAEEENRFYPVSWLAIRYHRLVCFYRKRYGGTRTRKRKVQNKWRQFAGLLHLYDRKPPPISREVRRQLDDYFKPEVEALESLLGRKVPAWHRDD